MDAGQLVARIVEVPERAATRRWMDDGNDGDARMAPMSTAGEVEVPVVAPGRQLARTPFVAAMARDCRTGLVDGPVGTRSRRGRRPRASVCFQAAPQDQVVAGVPLTTAAKPGALPAA